MSRISSNFLGRSLGISNVSGSVVGLTKFTLLLIRSHVFPMAPGDLIKRFLKPVPETDETLHDDLWAIVEDEPPIQACLQDDPAVAAGTANTGVYIYIFI